MSIPDFPSSLSDDKPKAGAFIDFSSEDIDFELISPGLIEVWLKKALEKENKDLQRLSFIFCSDNYLYQLNVAYLQHDTYTDVITFPYSEGDDGVEGDIFISIERVKENAATYGYTFEKELNRVMIHGVLHLCGYGDKSEKEKAQMRDKENIYLDLLDGMKNEV